MQIDHLSSQRTGRLIREALQQMPVDLNSTYVSMLKRISPADRVMARRALLWLSFSSRPLYLSELCEAVVLEKDDTTLDSDSRLQQPHLVLDICKGLADYNLETRQVTLAHSSIKTFLTSEAIHTVELIPEPVCIGMNFLCLAMRQYTGSATLAARRSKRAIGSSSRASSTPGSYLTAATTPAGSNIYSRASIRKPLSGRNRSTMLRHTAACRS